MVIGRKSGILLKFLLKKKYIFNFHFIKKIQFLLIDSEIYDRSFLRKIQAILILNER